MNPVSGEDLGGDGRPDAEEGFETSFDQSVGVEVDVGDGRLEK